MQCEIRITFDQVLDSSDLALTIDNTPVLFDLTANTAAINYPAQGLFHVLRLSNPTNKKFAIQQVQVGGSDLRKLIYLSWMQTHDGQRVQPATEFWENNQTWVLPFGYPLSGWLEEVERKIPNDLFGKNLRDYFNFYFPESIKINNQFPSMVQDFYQHNFSFTALGKDQVLDCPYLQYQRPIDQTLLAQARQEIIENTNYILEHGLNYGQYQSNISEYDMQNNDQCWRRVWLTLDRAPAESAELFPKVGTLIDSLGLDYWYSFIGLLPPGGFIYPHRDYDTFKQTAEEYFPYQGCTQLYIPIDWPCNNWIKFAGAGVLNLEAGAPMVINNDAYTHCLVNDSDQNRLVVGIRCHKNILNDCAPL